DHKFPVAQHHFAPGGLTQLSYSLEPKCNVDQWRDESQRPVMWIGDALWRAQLNADLLKDADGDGEGIVEVCACATDLAGNNECECGSALVVLGMDPPENTSSGTSEGSGATSTTSAPVTTSGTADTGSTSAISVTGPDASASDVSGESVGS